MPGSTCTAAVLRWVFSMFLAYATVTALAADQPPGCPRGDCGLRQAAAYPNIVIGRLVGIASDDEMHKLYHWAKQGAWRTFSDDEADYLHRNRLFIVAAGEQSTPVMLHMSHEEYKNVTFNEGDMVRYIPHRRGHEGVDESFA